MRIPVAAVAAFMMVLYWPGDGNMQAMVNRFSPAFFSEVLAPGRGTFSTQSCSTGKIGSDDCGEAG